MDIYSTRNKIKIITILKDTFLELSKASLLTPFYGTPGIPINLMHMNDLSGIHAACL